MYGSTEVMIFLTYFKFFSNFYNRFNENDAAIILAGPPEIPSLVFSFLET